jgi:hypothetical protein
MSTAAPPEHQPLLGLELKVRLCVTRVCAGTAPTTTTHVARDTHTPCTACATALCPSHVHPQASWAQRILRREKLVELRRYPIPSGYLHQPVLLLQTPDECPGVSTLPQHELPAGFAGAVVVRAMPGCDLSCRRPLAPTAATPSPPSNCTPVCACVPPPPPHTHTHTLTHTHHPTNTQAGTVVFDGQTAYTSYEQFLADVDKHCVQPGSTYAWEPGAGCVTAHQ